MVIILKNREIQNNTIAYSNFINELAEEYVLGNENEIIINLLESTLLLIISALHYCHGSHFKKIAFLYCLEIKFLYFCSPKFVNK